MATASAVPVPASHLDVARDAEPATKAANAAMAAKLPFAEQSDFEAANRGLIAPVPEGIVKSASGTVLWNLGEYAFIDGELAPATVNPSLWRMARLNMANGLFKVTDRLYQLRGFDIANMTVIEGDTGLILIDPLTTAEVARAGLAHYYAQCSITGSVSGIARAARFLADRDMQVLDAENVRRLNAVLLMSGMYNAAGDIAYRVGLPAKSGIGGGIVANLPGVGTLCAWSPPLDGCGNSVGGVAAIEEFARSSGWSIF